eukprot:TRINITY_DN6965_c0_g1_i1.p1 TRINITY_DN6965_c0_g1~~TRINITY_DN6965_c0_g1_i1.p1  ORF type:complete len:1299 (-),score=493.84 TRINITY_DN6965_c0_g1_i1:110-3871(-)
MAQLHPLLLRALDLAEADDGSEGKGGTSNVEFGARGRVMLLHTLHLLVQQYASANVMPLLNSQKGTEPSPYFDAFVRVLSLRPAPRLLSAAAVRSQCGYAMVLPVDAPRSTALHCIDHRFFSCLSPQNQGRLFSHLLHLLVRFRSALPPTAAASADAPLALVQGQEGDVPPASDSSTPALAALPATPTTFDHTMFLDVLLRVPMPVELFINSLPSAPAAPEEKSSKKRRSSRKVKAEASAGVDDDSALDVLNVLLEVLHSKRNVERLERVLGSLFSLLELLIDDASPYKTMPTRDFTLQLLLATMASIVGALGDGVVVSGGTPEAAAAGSAAGEDERGAKRLRRGGQQIAEHMKKEMRVDVIVACVRACKNPQIHNRALLLLTTIANLFPELVIDSVMPTFLFMGAYTLRKDDNYTFHVIQKIITSIVPQVASGGRERVIPLLSIFVDVLHHIPAHRRILLFGMLAHSLSFKCFPELLLLLLRKHIVENSEKGAAEKAVAAKSSGDTPLPEDIPLFCLNLLGHLNPVVVLLSFASIASVLSAFSNGSFQDDLMSTAGLVGTALDQAQLKEQCLSLFTNYLASEPFLTRVVEFDPSERAKAQAIYRSLFRSLVQLLSSTVVERQRTKLRPLLAPLGAALGTLHTCMEQLSHLMSVKAFVHALAGLVAMPSAHIRRRSLLLLNEKIEEFDGQFSAEHVELFLSFAPKVLDVVQASSDPDSPQYEPLVNKQTALLSLEILVRSFSGAVNKAQQSDLVGFVPLVLQCVRDHRHPQVVSSGLICLATYCAQMGTKMVRHLPAVVELVLEVIDAVGQPGQARIDLPQDGDVADEEDLDQILATRAGDVPSPSSRSELCLLLHMSALSCLEVVVLTLAKFMSPYLEALLRSLLHRSVLQSSAKQVRVKAGAVLGVVAAELSMRLLLDPIRRTFSFAVSNGVPSTRALLRLLGQASQRMQHSDVSEHCTKLFAFFIELFDLRSAKLGAHVSDIAAIEREIVDSFMFFVLQLDEVLFRPLFVKTLEWAELDQVAPRRALARRRFFFLLVQHLASQLQSIFSPYFEYLTTSCISILTEVQELVEEAAEEDDTADEEELSQEADDAVLYVVKCLGKCFEHDGSGASVFLTPERFDALLEPLVNVLDRNPDGAIYDHIIQELVHSLGAMACATSNDLLRKPLNYQVLLKTRSNDHRVRLAALQVIHEFYEQTGEEWLKLLPESVPFIAELMEDSNPHVEQLCQTVALKIDEYLKDSGEKLSDYLT